MEYTYETIEGGERISSGVAQYEPIVGGEENALRYPKYFTGKIPLKTNNNLFFEHPINEAYMPGPLVGYSKVIVSSLNTAEQITKSETQSANIGRAVTGVKQYEFYTAKNFPVIVEETEIDKKSFNVPITVPFIGAYRRNKMVASQGYKIELNDMHGKTKSVSSYGLNPLNYSVKNEPITSVVMNYQSTSMIYHGNFVRRLNNEVQTKSSFDNIEETRVIGVEHEFFTDQRETKNWSITAGLIGNVDQVLLGPVTLPFPSVWGSIESNKNELRTFVTNKIIHKSGVLISTSNINESYTATAQNILFDRESGRPILTKTNNEFNNSVYSFNHPAHWEYEGMGHAYKNINLEFKASVISVSTISTSNNLYKCTIPDVLDKLVPGDEFIVRTTVNGLARNFKGTFITNDKNTADQGIFYISFPKTAGNIAVLDDIYFKLYRSGRRNHFMQDAGGIVTLGASPFDLLDNITVTSTSEITGATKTVATKKLTNDVLSNSAVTYRDNWESEFGLEGVAYSDKNENPYATGEQGIWRVHKSYTYVGDRIQGDDGTGNKEVHTYEDGVMENVTLFNWQVSNFDKYDPYWFTGGEVTRYNEFGYETENVDRLGIYSSALYGYNKAFAIAVGGNAKYNEIGVEDFERFVIGSSYDVNAMDEEGNLNFYNNYDANNSINVLMADKFTIIEGEVNAFSNDLLILVDNSTIYDWTSADISQVDFSIVTPSGNYIISRELNDLTIDVSTYPGKVLLTLPSNLIIPKTIDAGTAISYLNTGEITGQVTTYRTKDNGKNSSVSGSVEFSDTYAHTGKHSMKLSSDAIFIHPHIELEVGKAYVMSCWIRRDDSNVPFYNTNNYNIYFGEKLVNGQWSTQPVIKTGKIVEGWQKVELEFTATLGNNIQTSFTTGANPLYIDDIRISPKQGGIMSYVYDPLNFRLKATLDANNYATFFYYDEQGNLHLTKRETEEGVFTISENHSHSKSTN